MRKLLFAFLLLVAAPALISLNVRSAYASSGGGHGTKIPASEVPTAVKKSFHQSFPTAKQPEWEVTAQYYGGSFYTASFKFNGQKWEATFDTGGTLLSAGPKA